jgi:prepilin-type processing-associated H-X9-DG protein
LIELLVVISIIALLISILLPSLSSARRQAKTVVCASQLRGFGTGLNTYLTDYVDWIPGVNTSSVAQRAQQFSTQGLQSSFMPVQKFDWMSPLVTETEMPWKRAERFHFLLDQFRCPSLPDVPSAAVPFDNTADEDDFGDIELWPTTSYLMPVSFQYWGDQDAGKVLARQRGMSLFRVTALAAPEAYETVRIDRYISRIDRIGNPADKLFVADGTRYLDDELRLDHDISPFPTHFGAFGTSGGWWRGSTAYGVATGSPMWAEPMPVEQGSRGSPSNGRNLQLSYRHGARGVTNGSARTNPGSINALFYDGHVDRLGDKASRRIDYWYPRGAVVQQPTEGMTSVEEGHVIR